MTNNSPDKMIIGMLDDSEEYFEWCKGQDKKLKMIQSVNFYIYKEIT